MKKKTKIIIGTVIVITFVAAAITVGKQINVHQEGTAISIIGGADGPTSIFIAGKLTGENKEMAYISITMDEAKQIFESDIDGTYIILDVRREDEFAEGHIPGAINIANETIGTVEPAELPDKNQVIYVYCRSGNRSKQAAEKLAAMGYSNIIEFGGIIDWTGELAEPNLA